LAGRVVPGPFRFLHTGDLHLDTRHQVIYFTCHPGTAEVLDPGGERTVELAS
jgi:hypothetical protein